MIKEGDFVVLVDNSHFHRVVQAESKKMTYSNKCAIDLSQVIGKPWETAFSVVDRQSGALKEIDEPQSQMTSEFFTGLNLEENDQEETNAPMTEEIKDNRLMVDNNRAQKITAAEID